MRKTRRKEASNRDRSALLVKSGNRLQGSSSVDVVIRWNEGPMSSGQFRSMSGILNRCNLHRDCSIREGLAIVLAPWVLRGHFYICKIDTTDGCEAIFSVCWLNCIRGIIND